MRMQSLFVLVLSITFMGTAVHAQAPEAPLQFDGTGILHVMRANSVVINDIFHRLAPGVEFKSSDADAFTRVLLQPGDTVGYFKDDQGRIIALWKLKRRS